MPKTETDLIKVNVRVNRADLEFLNEVYNPDGKGVGYNEVIRNVIHAHVKATKERIARKQGDFPHDPQ